MKIMSRDKLVLTSFHVQNVKEHRYLLNKCFIIYQRNAAKNVAACRNTSHLIKLKMRLLKYVSVLQQWCDVTSDAT